MGAGHQAYLFSYLDKFDAVIMDMWHQGQVKSIYFVYEIPSRMSLHNMYYMFAMNSISLAVSNATGDKSL